MSEAAGTEASTATAKEMILALREIIYEPALALTYFEDTDPRYPCPYDGTVRMARSVVSVHDLIRTAEERDDADFETPGFEALP